MRLLGLSPVTVIAAAVLLCRPAAATAESAPGGVNGASITVGIDTAVANVGVGAITGVGANAGIGASTGNRLVWIVDATLEGHPEGLPLRNGIIPQIPAQYDIGVVDRTVRALSGFYSENGYPYNRITASIIGEGHDSSLISLHLLVVADERVCSGPAVIAGVLGRRDIYIKDVRIAPGRPYNAADVNETVRRLSMRPYVSSASAASPVIIEDAEPCGDGALRTAVTPIIISENRGTQIEGALGYRSGQSGDDGTLTGRVDLSFVNMLRQGEMIDVSYFGATAAQRLKLAGSRPWMFGLPVEAGVTLGLEVEDGDVGQTGYGIVSGEVWGALEINARYRGGVTVKASETVMTGGGGQEGEGEDQETAGSGRYGFYGADVFAELLTGALERGATVWEFGAKTGSGIANRERSYNRSGAELTVGVHAALKSTPYAVAARIRGMALFTDEERLTPAEMYRIGGHGSLRGYSEDEFAFRAALYSQLEALYYFNRYGAIYMFMDAGAGADSPKRITLSAAKEMLGYGLGTRFPSRLGTISIEWARNADDDAWSLGRVHVGVRRNL